MLRLIVIQLLLLATLNGFSQKELLNIGEMHSIQSAILNEKRTIAIATPENYQESNENYQVLYVLDGEWNFHFVAALVRKLESSGDIPKTIVVGIINNNRSKDLTPPGKQDNLIRFGGGEKFLNFLTQELKPWIEAKYRTHPYSILAGHSFGGLFSIYSMMKSPNAFQAFIALSPSLGRNDEQQVKQAQVFFSKADTFPSSLYLGMGNETGYTLISSKKFNHILDRHAPIKMRFKFEQLLEENHVSITTIGFINGLKFIHDQFNVEELKELDEIFLVESHYATLSKRYGYTIPVPEASYHKFVKEQIAEREYDYALYILDKYKKRYPVSVKLLLQYADVYLLKGDFNKAKEYYLSIKAMGIEDENIDRILKRLTQN